METKIAFVVYKRAKHNSSVSAKIHNCIVLQIKLLIITTLWLILPMK